MIRKLVQDDAEALRLFLNKRYEYSAFIAGNLENYGFASPVTDYWGLFVDDSVLVAFLHRYDGFFLVDAEERTNCSGFIDIMLNSAGYQSLAGRAEIVGQFIDKVPGTARIKNYMRYVNDSGRNFAEIRHNVQLAGIDDYNSVNDLLVAIDEFGFYNGEIRERYLRTVARREARYYCCVADNKFVACAASAAESEKAAVIVSVCCRQEYRRCGYAEACVKKLCQVLSAENKEIFLYCENPAAAALYGKLGFEAVGSWLVIE